MSPRDLIAQAIIAATRRAGGRAPLENLPVKPVTTSPPKERIAASALQTPDGRVFTGTTHGDAMEAAVKAGADPETKFADGFVTSAGRYIGREEALAIAERENQLSRPTAAREYGRLLSEDSTLTAPRVPPSYMLPGGIMGGLAAQDQYGQRP
jgi:hypothetical protein